jgi:hypothetical protein
VLEAKSFTGSQVKKNDAWVTVVNRLNLGTSWVGGEAQLVELMPYEALSSNPSNTKRRKTKINFGTSSTPKPVLDLGTLDFERCFNGMRFLETLKRSECILNMEGTRIESLTWHLRS